MRERAFTTTIIWLALVIAISRMVDGLQSVTSSFMQIGLGVLMFVLILAAMGGTLAIWATVTDKSEQKQTQAQSEKAKRDERDARIKRLMATMDDDELEALEERRIGDDGERVSLENLMRK